MTKRSKIDLSSLYPKPKSYDEREAERRVRELKHRPRFVSARISLWTTLGIVTVLVTYQLVSRVILNDLSFGGGVLIGVSLSLLSALATGAILLYLYSLINNLVTRLLISIPVLYGVLTFIIIVFGLILTTLARYQYIDTLTIITVLLFNFLAMYFAINFIIKHGPKA